MKFDPSQLNASYPELTKERLAEIVLQQTAMIQRMQERIIAVEQEVVRLRMSQTPNVSGAYQQPMPASSGVQKAVVQESVPTETGGEAIVYKVARAVFHTSWMAILLGIFIEVVLVIVATFGGTFGDVRPFVADMFQKVSWGFLVCIALILTTATTRFRVPAMSIMGLLAAPAAVIIARAIHFGARYALGLPAVSGGGPSPLVIAAIKSVEYAFLGATLAFIARFAWGRALTHIAVGLFFGIIFGGALLALSVKTAATAIPALELVARGLNELIFPVGCALITFAGQFFGKLLPSQTK